MLKITKKIIFLTGLCLGINVSVYGMSCNEQSSFVTHKGHYYTTTVRRYTFENALNFAKANGGYLAIPNNAEENAFIAKLVPRGNYAWIGIHDPSKTANYCYENKSCANNASRFRNVKGSGLAYANWDSNEPNNLVKDKDIIYDEYSKQDRQVVDILGEHWVAITPQGVWADLGNHAGEGMPRAEYAILEFDTLPKCSSSSNINTNVALDIRSPDEVNRDDVSVNVGANDANNNGWNADGSCGGELYIFNGQTNSCRIRDLYIGKIECCDKDKVLLGLISCRENEELLAEKKKDKLCVEIGEYCSRKDKLIGCTEWSISHCCFNSVLARIFNEQGRVQLGKGWGSADAPQCRGFTPVEFQKLDFSKIDLSEYTNSLSIRVNSSFSQQQAQNIKNKVNQNINNAKQP